MKPDRGVRLNNRRLVSVPNSARYLRVHENQPATKHDPKAGVVRRINKYVRASYENKITGRSSDHSKHY